MPRRAQSHRPTVERKIYFHRANVGVNPAGRPLNFQPTPILRHIEGLAFTAEGRYLSIGDENSVCCWPDPSGSRLQFGTVRRTGLPQVDEDGRLRALPIRPTAGLAEQIHVAFYAHNLVGSEFNFYGPRLSRLSEYFALRAKDVGQPVTFEPLLRLDVLKQLRRLRDVRVFDLKVRTSFVETVRQADESIGDMLRAAQLAGEPYEVEVILRARPRSQEGLGGRIRAFVNRLARSAELRSGASRFVVQGFDPELDRVEEIDVLHDQFIATKRIVRLNERTRALDPDAAFAAIDEAHQELRSRLVEAATVVAE